MTATKCTVRSIRFWRSIRVDSELSEHNRIYILQLQIADQELDCNRCNTAVKSYTYLKGSRLKTETDLDLLNFKQLDLLALHSQDRKRHRC